MKIEARSTQKNTVSYQKYKQLNKLQRDILSEKEKEKFDAVMKQYEWKETE